MNCQLQLICIFYKNKKILLYRTIKHVVRERGWFDQVLSPLRVINKGASDHLQSRVAKLSAHV